MRESHSTHTALCVSLSTNVSNGPWFATATHYSVGAGLLALLSHKQLHARESCSGAKAWQKGTLTAVVVAYPIKSLSLLPVLVRELRRGSLGFWSRGQERQNKGRKASFVWEKRGEFMMAAKPRQRDRHQAGGDDAMSGFDVCAHSLAVTDITRYSRVTKVGFDVNCCIFKGFWCVNLVIVTS